MSNNLSGLVLEPWSRGSGSQYVKLLSDFYLTMDSAGGSLGELLASTPMGNPRTAITETMWGLNHRSLANSIPINKDHYGLTFFTRPDMCLSQYNLRSDPRLAAMLDPDGNSYPRAIRAMLDARHNLINNDDQPYPSGLIDEKCAFLPLLSNQLVSMSGWEDLMLPTQSLKEGVYGETYSFVDGILENYRTYDITANFRNIVGDPITYLFFYWLVYAAGVYQGDLVPWESNIRNNRIDYQTRVYRIVLDHTKRYVQKIAYCGAAFPIGLQIGQHFNFESDAPINRTNDQISVTFRAVGAEYLTARAVYAFNKTVCMCNPSMYANNRVGMGLRKIPYEYIYLFNYQGYPYINLVTNELEWYTYEEELERIFGSVSSYEAASREEVPA